MSGFLSQTQAVNAILGPNFNTPVTAGNLLSSASSGISSAFNSVQSTVASAFVPPALTSPVFANYVAKFSGTDANGKKIGVNGKGIVLPMPEQFDIQTSSDFHQLLPGGSIVEALGGFTGQKAFSFLNSTSKAVQSTTGYSGQDLNLSKLLWANTSPIVLNLIFQLNALYNAKDDVQIPVQQLLSLSLPITVGQSGFFRAPGPDVFTSKNKALNSQYKINLSLGKNIKFSNVVVLNAQAQIDTINDANGHYISATLQVTVSTDRIYAVSDLQNAFSLKNQSVYSGTTANSAVKKASNATHSLLGGIGNAVSSGANYVENSVRQGFNNIVSTYSK